ncbi:MAG: 16S rRNA (cytosine(1402)-N(4))-methyltransferase RsmH [Oscillospiraceae bacterium]|jgi:16S rRNA (cytosine1402-N4)-methyltransferase|nr:16S rRNA (cytosine(1402)-N(4))-methyltransferase RsmH [Oscillospiraceae bacterium]
MPYDHTPVMLARCLEMLRVRPEGFYVDATAGAGGHAEAVAHSLKGGRLLCLDKDPEALERARARLAPFGDRVLLVRSDYRRLSDVLAAHRLPGADGILFDLGVSSPQFDDPARGFSYRFDAALDMRMNPEDPLTAREIVNTWPQSELRRILFDYGEEPHAPLIAAALVRRRAEAPIETTGQLADIIAQALPAKSRRRPGHPAKRSFQAVRIAVNDELGGLAQGLAAAIGALRPGGRLVVLSFHSLEDRIVKTALADAARGCICPKDLPVCVCGHTPALRILTRRPLTADPTELSENRRAHSAKLRAAEKL